MALKIAKKTGTASTMMQVKDKGTVVAEETTEDKVDIPAAKAHSGPWCEVGVDMSYTHNLGNYQSAKIGISLKVPCQHSEIDSVFDYSKEWVDTKLQSMIEELQSE
ncbi:MAG: hypothetical protein KJZ83_00225 [Burkholderiaceae bacterium]|nr:hypothetical protein [Burkholderiaceae bacterium]